MKWIATIIMYCLTRHLLHRRNICNAWTTTNGALRPTTRGGGYRTPVPSKNHRPTGCSGSQAGDAVRYHSGSGHGRGDAIRNNARRCGPTTTTRLRSHQSLWTGEMAPFSEFATHVLVGKEDGPATVESAILRSMTALGASSYGLSEDGNTYSTKSPNDDNKFNHNHDHTKSNVLIIDDSDDVIQNEADGDGCTKIIAHQLKDHPPNSPMTPRQVLYLGGVWYLSAEDYRKNKELLEQEEEDEKVKAESGNDQSDRKKRKIERSNKSVKPSRLSLSDASMELYEGDYLRIHHTPRRFPGVYDVDWSFDRQHDSDEGEEDDLLPAVVRHQGQGYCIIDKPTLIPVHATVDNSVENVARQLYLALEEKQKQNTTTFSEYHTWDDTADTTQIELQQGDNPENPTYLAAVQRLDQNTSGLMVLATSPEFAAYFSQLLERKSMAVLDQHSNSNSNSNSSSTKYPSATIEKGYKCLVCIQPDEANGESVIQAWQRLSKLQRPKATSSEHNDSGAQSNTNNTVIIRHYLQASDRAPKLFVDRIPEDDNDSKWYECLMEIKNVGEPIPLYATNNDDGASPSLALSLWPTVGSSGSNRMPPTAKAVVEVEVSLITGRTHQIRGQLSKLGFPIVGDEQYGGAVADLTVSTTGATAQQSDDPQLLALQCCHIGFRDAEYELVWHKKKRREILRGRPSRSGKWVRATLQKAWWTPPLEKQKSAATTNGDRFSDIDFQDADNIIPTEIQQDSEKSMYIDTTTSTTTTAISLDIRPDMLPPTVQLSPGRNKYVVAKLRDPSTTRVRWFVQSAPLPYHAEVAFDLVEWIAAVPGYEQIRVEVTGGGRIDYNPAASTVSVYGFSYRYGKGDHARVANLIETSELGADLTVTYDLSDNLY